MINIITLNLGTSETYYTKEKITLEFLKEFLNKVEPTLDVRIYSDHSSQWLNVEGQIWAERQEEWPLFSCYEETLNWKRIEEIVL